MSSRGKASQISRPNGNSKPVKRKAEQDGSNPNNQKKAKLQESARNTRATEREARRASANVSNQSKDRQSNETSVNDTRLSGNKFFNLAEHSLGDCLKQRVIESGLNIKGLMRRTKSQADGVELRRSTRKTANPPKSQNTTEATGSKENSDDKSNTATEETSTIPTEQLEIESQNKQESGTVEPAVAKTQTAAVTTQQAVNGPESQPDISQLQQDTAPGASQTDEKPEASTQQVVSEPKSQPNPIPLQEDTTPGTSQIVENSTVVETTQSESSASSADQNSSEKDLVKSNLGIPETAAVTTQQAVNGPESQPDSSQLQQGKPEASTQQAVNESESQPDPRPLQEDTTPETSQIVENTVAVEPTPPDVLFPLPPRAGLFKTLDDPKMKMQDFVKLDGVEWIGDPVVDHCVCSSAMKHLTEENFDQTYIATTLFFTKLQNQKKMQSMKFCDPSNISYSDQHQLQMDCASIQQWTKKVSIFSKKVIVIPVNTGDHWMLALVINPAGVIRNPINKNESGDDFCHIIIIDSLVKNEELRKNHARHIIINWLKRTFVEKQVEGEFMENQVRLSVPANLPKQPNTTDCGIYAIFFADTVFSNIERFFEVEETWNLDWDFLNPRAAVEMEFSPRKVLKSIILENAPEDVMEKVAKFYHQKDIWDWIQKLEIQNSNTPVVNSSMADDSIILLD